MMRLIVASRCTPFLASTAVRTPPARGHAPAPVPAPALRAHVWTLALALVCMSASAHAQETIELEAPEYGLPEVALIDLETELQLPASTLAPQNLLQGERFKVNDTARISGHIARFTIQTDWGPLEADGVEMLAIRVGEVPAMQKLHDAKMAKVFAKSAKKALVDTANAVGQVVMNPVDTVTGLPRGVVRFFRREVRENVRDVVKAGDDVRRDVIDKDKQPNAGIPMQPETPKIEPESDDWKPKAKATAKKQGKRLLLRYLGYNKAKREVAKQLEIDPYTKNPIITERLDKLAWAGWGGSRASKMAMGAVGGLAGDAIAEAKRLNEIVWLEEPMKVSDFNRERLHRFDEDCDGHEFRDFLDNGAFSPSRQTSLIDAFIQLQPTRGCETFFSMAAQLDGELEARYLINALRLANHFYAGHQGRRRLNFIGTGFVLETARDAIVMPLPLDYLQWTAETRDYFDLPEFRKLDKTVLITGHASPRAREALTERGWSIVERTPYEGAPKYAE